MRPLESPVDWLSKRPLIGVVGLPPLPGSQGWRGGGLGPIRERALRDSEAYTKAGFDALMLQNVGDLPVPERVGPETVACLSAVGSAVANTTDLPLGVSVLKSDGPASVAIAQAIGASFVRIKVWVGAMVGAEGLVQGCAREVLRYRRLLQADEIRIWADVHDRTGVPLVPMSIEQTAHEAIVFGRADGLVVTGSNPSETVDWVQMVKRTVGPVPVVVGGGADVHNLPELFHCADAVIVATAAKVDGMLQNPVDARAARALVEAARRARSTTEVLG